MTITIPSAFFDKYFEACDFFLDDLHIASVCKLIYPPKKISCTNCTNMIGATSSNVYAHGGPMPFSMGKCGVCGGSGYKEQEITEEINLRVYWRKKDWIKISQVEFKNCDAQIIGKIEDLPKVQQCNEIILLSTQSYGLWRMQKASSGFPHGFGKSRYFVMFLRSV